MVSELVELQPAARRGSLWNGPGAFQSCRHTAAWCFSILQAHSPLVLFNPPRTQPPGALESPPHTHDCPATSNSSCDRNPGPREGSGSTHVREAAAHTGAHLGRGVVALGRVLGQPASACVWKAMHRAYVGLSAVRACKRLNAARAHEPERIKRMRLHAVGMRQAGEGSGTHGHRAQARAAQRHGPPPCHSACMGWGAPL